MAKQIYFTLLCAAYLQASAQTPAQNHDKYWYYRYRLINNFLLVGDCQGCSIPAYRRGLGNNKHAGEEVLDWGDGQDLGWYIGILATEYGLLIKHNQDASGTKKELFYALEAFNRLDYNAEVYWTPPYNAPNPSNGSYNGFFIRDDVPGTVSDFVQNHYEHFNSSYVQTQRPVRIATSIFSETHPPEENSQDNVIHLMMGLALVNKFVDEGAVYHDGAGVRLFRRDGEASIRNEARNISHDVVRWIQVHSWVVKNAVTGLNVEEGACCPAVISYGFAEAYCKATDKTSMVLHLFTGFDCGVFADAISIPNLGIWWALQQPLALAVPPSFTAHIIGILAAIGNSWYLSPTPLVLVNTTAGGLAAFFPSQRMEYLPLLRQVLHGGINLVSNATYTDLLNSAPCLGPYNLGNGNYPVFEWSSDHRFRDPEDRGAAMPLERQGEYSGLDYMLLFNLYAIAKDSYLPVYFDKRDRNVTVSFPLPAFPTGSAGSQAFPLTIEAFDSISANNHINFGGTPSTRGDVKYRAGREIALAPGFAVDAGANFGAYVKPFTCDSSGNYVRATTGTENVRTVYDTPTSSGYYADDKSPTAEARSQTWAREVESVQLEE